MLLKKVAIIVAGGKGLRLPGDVPKQFLSIGGIPMLMRTIMVFRSYDPLIEIILVLPARDFKLWDNLCRQYDFMVPLTLVAGGDTRFQSVKNGLEKVTGPGCVAVHDGVRPLVTTAIIASSFEIANRHKTAVASVALKESIRELRMPLSDQGASDSDQPFSKPPGSKQPDSDRTGSEQPGNEQPTHEPLLQSWVAVDRSRFRSMQTPQTFDIDLLKSAYALAEDPGFTDDASVVERAGHAITLFEGSYENLKITTPVDVVAAEAILKSRNTTGATSSLT